MSQLAALSEQDIEERFHVGGKTEIRFMLAGFAKARESFAVRFNGGREHFMTIMLAVQPEKNRFIIDCTGSPETNRRFLDSERNLFVGRPGSIQVQFATGRATSVNYEGAEAFALPMPDDLMRLQRRENFRVETPRVKPLMLEARLPDGSMASLPAHDISITGIGLVAVSEPLGWSTEIVLDRCTVTLPEDGRGALHFGAIVRHITPSTLPSGGQIWRIGLEYVKLPPADQVRIRRYIDRLERERREWA